MGTSGPPIALGLAVAALLALPGCSGCGEPDDERAIRALVDEAAALAGKGDVGGIMDLAAEDLTVEPGSRDRQEVRAVLALAFRRYGRIRIEHPPPSVEIDEDRRGARVELPFLVLREGRSAPELGDLVGDPERWFEGVAELGDAYYLTLRLAKADGAWLVQRARIRGTRGPLDL